VVYGNFHPEMALAFFQSTQLSLFERFQTQATSGIDATGITSGMQHVAYVVLLVGFLWQAYESALHGGDVRGLGASLIKYVATAVVVMNYGAVFNTINQGFVNAGNWINSAAGVGSLLDNWKSDLLTQFSQVGSQKLWGIITGDIPGLLDGLLIIVAYCLYPIVIVVFGFFYIFYGSILYIFGPIVIALMPFGAANRIAKAYVENVFIWNAWPVLYGGFGALLSAVQMGQIAQMLAQNNFLGGLGNLEGSILIGIVSIVYSLAIAVIPFIAKRIVSGDVGSTAAAMVGTAVTALTAGAAGFEGAVAGVSAAGGASAGTGSAGGYGAASAATAHSLSAAGGNLPAPPQQVPSSLSTSTESPGFANAATLDGHADRIRSSFSDVMGMSESGTGTVDSATADAESSIGSQAQAASGSAKPAVVTKVAATTKRGPSVHRYNLGTWTAYHAARIAAGSIAGATRRSGDKG